MMKKFYLILTCAALCACGGGNAKQPVADVETTKDTMQVTKGVSKPGGIPVLDVNKKYPKKTLYLQDLGDVEYVPIETTESMLWRGRDVYYVDDKYIIGANNNCGVMVHDRNGKALHSFNKKGKGPQEWQEISDLCYDSGTDEIFILSMLACKIYVYDIKGNFKRSFNTGYTGKNRAYKIEIFNDKELYVYIFDNTFARISRTDGKTKAKKNFSKSKEMNLFIRKDGYAANTSAPTYIKSNGNFILTPYASDTTYIYQPGNEMKPFITRVPSVHNTETPIFLFPGIDTPRYYITYSIKKEWDFKANKGFPETYYVFDKKFSQFYELEDIINKDYIEDGHTYLTACNNVDVPTNHCVKTMNVEKLCQSYQEGKLKGTLKEVASKLKEDDNPVLMIVHLKR